ncbi:MAG: hypothetical protein IKE58_01095 [Blautia sp.]|nr:hypothetical protein [Blautia sp.]
MEKESKNDSALAVPKDREGKERFLLEEETHILRLAAKILHKPISFSDEEWSVAFQAVSSALDSFDEEKGNFWSYAALVMDSRLKDYYRAANRRNPEVLVSPEAFEGELEEDDPGFSLQHEIQQHTISWEDTSLKDEILALQEELKRYDISFFDLTESSPKAEKTRRSCADLIRAFFAPPPPLVSKMRKSGILPAKELLSRTKISRKILDRYRKYLITSALILDGDYPGLSDYLQYVKKDLRTGGGVL